MAQGRINGGRTIRIGCAGLSDIPRGCSQDALRWMARW